jgi:hypothetical protein
VPQTNGRGDVAFIAKANHSLNPQIAGIWKYSNGNLNAIAKPGDTIVGLPSGVSIGAIVASPAVFQIESTPDRSLWLSETGTVVFYADLTGTGITPINQRAIVAYLDNKLTLVAQANGVVGAPFTTDELGLPYRSVTVNVKAVNGDTVLYETNDVLKTGLSLWLWKRDSTVFVITGSQGNKLLDATDKSYFMRGEFSCEANLNSVGNGLANYPEPNLLNAKGDVALLVWETCTRKQANGGVEEKVLLSWWGVSGGKPFKYISQQDQLKTLANLYFYSETNSSTKLDKNGDLIKHAGLCESLSPCAPTFKYYSTFKIKPSGDTELLSISGEKLTLLGSQKISPVTLARFPPAIELFDGSYMSLAFTDDWVLMQAKFKTQPYATPADIGTSDAAIIVEGKNVAPSYPDIYPNVPNGLKNYVVGRYGHIYMETTDASNPLVYGLWYKAPSGAPVRLFYGDQLFKIKSPNGTAFEEVSVYGTAGPNAVTDDGKLAVRLGRKIIALITP